NSMCQKRSGLPRSMVSSAPEMMMPMAATSYPVRTTGRSSALPNQSSTAARKYAPPASPPTKKYGMMNQVQWGAPLKNVSGGMACASRPAGGRVFVHPPLAQADERQHAHDGRARDGEAGALAEVLCRQLGMPWQAVHLGLVHQQVERVQPAERSSRARAVQFRVHALRLELCDPLLGAGPQLGNRPELDRVGGAGLGARRLEPDLQPVVEIGRAHV